jgi:hypothetical protein
MNAAVFLGMRSECLRVRKPAAKLLKNPKLLRRRGIEVNNQVACDHRPAYLWFPDISCLYCITAKTNS